MDFPSNIGLNWGMLASFAFAVQNCSIIKGNAPMLNRHEIGHAPASLASAKGKTVFINKARSEAV